MYKLDSIDIIVEKKKTIQLRKQTNICLNRSELFRVIHSFKDHVIFVDLSISTISCQSFCYIYLSMLIND
ncbi:unnamed protein product [Rotaria socialis]